MKYLLVLIMTLLGAFGAFFLKKAADKGFKEALKKYQFYLGGLCYFLSAIANIYLYNFFDFIVLLPMTALTYVWTFILAGIFLKEKIGIYKIIGIGAIFCGLALLVV